MQNYVEIFCRVLDCTALGQKNGKFSVDYRRPFCSVRFLPHTRGKTNNLNDFSEVISRSLYAISFQITTRLLLVHADQSILHEWIKYYQNLPAGWMLWCDTTLKKSCGHSSYSARRRAGCQKLRKFSVLTFPQILRVCIYWFVNIKSNCESNHTQKSGNRHTKGEEFAFYKNQKF